MRRRVSCSVIRGRRQAAGILLAIVLAGCGGSSSSAPATSPGEASPSGAAAAPTGSVPPGPIPLIVDNDMSFDDVMAIAYLATQPAVEILAVTVTGTGIAHCGPGARNARSLLHELQAPAVPTACGSEEPVAGGKVFPEEWRTGADGLWGLKVAGIPGTPKGTAVDLLAEVIGGSDRPITVLATGPMTNLAQALAADPTLADGIARIVIMGGAVDVDGNATVDGSSAPAEWNFAADPAAAAAVVASGIPITLVPLDSTNDVKITRAFADTLHADASAGPANLIDELLLRTPMSIDVDYFWDALAAVLLVEPAIVTTEEARIAVTTEGPEAGRTIRSDDGTAITLATAADRAAFETAFLAGLRAGGPRQTPLEVKGDLAITFDGTACVSDVPATAPAATYRISYVNDSKVESVAVVVRLVEGSTYQDLDAWMEDHPGTIEQPPMVEVPGFVYLEPGKTGSGLAELVPGDAFVACLVAREGQQEIISGPRFRIE
jgi:pyrimidine-specific ribonucleoside hydrolase